MAADTAIRALSCVEVDGPSRDTIRFRSRSLERQWRGGHGCAPGLRREWPRRDVASERGGRGRAKDGGGLRTLFGIEIAD